MTVLTRTPQNTNPLQATKFLLTFDRISTVTYFCQTVNLPGVRLGEVDRVTPFLDMYSPGTKLQYDPLDVSFIIDEGLNSWRNLYDWFISIADPEGFGGRDHSRELRTPGLRYFSDAKLVILSALNNPVFAIEFKNVFPLTMNSLDFDTTTDANKIITCSATFRYESYRYLTEV